MTLFVPDQLGEIRMLQYIVGLDQMDNPVLHLFSNDHDPSDSSRIASLTEVATLTGYRSMTLGHANWTVGQSGGVTTASYTERTFTFTTSATAYGYYVTNESNELLWLERFSGAPFVIPDGGGSISITPRLTLS